MGIHLHLGNKNLPNQQQQPPYYSKSSVSNIHKELKNNETIIAYIQSWYFQGKECTAKEISAVNLQPIYSENGNCLKSGKYYRKAYCKENEAIIENMCDETCTHCSGKTTELLFGCRSFGLGSMIQSCGKLNH